MDDGHSSCQGTFTTLGVTDKGREGLCERVSEGSWGTTRGREGPDRLAIVPWGMCLCRTERSQSGSLSDRQGLDRLAIGPLGATLTAKIRTRIWTILEAISVFGPCRVRTAAAPDGACIFVIPGFCYGHADRADALHHAAAFGSHGRRRFPVKERARVVMFSEMIGVLGSGPCARGQTVATLFRLVT